MNFLTELKDRTDAELIEEGRKLAGQMEVSKLRLGRLALAFAPMGEAGLKTGAIKRVENYAQEVGVDAEQMKRYRATAFAWSQFDIAENEFPYSVLRIFAPAVKKEAILQVLRNEKPAEGWKVQTARETIEAKNLMPERKLAGGHKPKTPYQYLADAAILLTHVVIDTKAPIAKHDKARLERSLKKVVRELQRIQQELNKTSVRVKGGIQEPVKEKVTA